MERDEDRLREAVREAFNKTSWGNTTETVDDWLRIVRSGNEVEQARLFERLFREDSDGAITRRLFSPTQIARFIATFDRPYDRAHLEKKRKVWRAVYLDEQQTVPELEWLVREKAP
ncbi:MAG: hypothetical protein EA426_14480 [Spirochaetaceae bacterium]|nr:MAG: hypothetical protein EA426_14480 [Spirochaetaceae bacterium]